MQTITTKMTAKVAAVATGLAMAVSMLSFVPTAQAALTEAQIQSIISLLQSFGADSATIANVQTSLRGGTPAVPPATPAPAFTRNLTIGSTGEDVRALQRALIDRGFSIPAGVTGYFGTQTRTAVASWQSSKNIAPAVGFFGPISRAAFIGQPGAPVTPPAVGVGLRVSLATDSPNNTVLVQGQSAGELGRFTFSNPTGTNVNVTNLSFRRIGVSTDLALTNVYLFDGERRLTDPVGLSASVFSFTDTAGVFTVPAGGTRTVSVRADIGSAAGQQIGVQLSSVGSTGTLDPAVSFPINSHMQTVSSATVAAVLFTGAVTPSGGTIAPGTDITVFRSTVDVSTRAVLLRAITLENRGTTVDADLQNLRLLVGGVQVGSTVANTSERRVTFDLSANPVRLEPGLREIRVTADIVGGSGDNFHFQIRRAVDARFIDVDLNAGVTATGTMAPVTATGIDGVALSVVRAAASPSGLIPVDGRSVLLGSFEFRATGEDVRVEQITVTTTAGGGLDNGRIFLNGVQVGSILDIATTTFPLGAGMILARGTTAVVEVYSDVRTAGGTSISTGTGVSVSVAVAAGDARGVRSGRPIGASITAVPGHTVTVSASVLTATRFTGYGDQTMVAGTNNARIGSFVLSAGATEGVNVNAIDVNFGTDPSTRITDLRLVDSATGAQIGSTRSSVSTANTFSISVVIPASGTRTIDVFANIRPAVTGAIPTMTIGPATGGTGAVTGSTVTIGVASSALQTITIGTSLLTTTVNAGRTPDSANVVMGASGVTVGSFRFFAQHSPFTVDRVLVKVPATAADSVTGVTLRWPGGPTAGVTQVLAPAIGGQTHATATFTGLAFNIPLNTEANLDVSVGISAQGSAISGRAISVELDGNEGFRAVDSAGTAVTTLTGSADLLSNSVAGKGTVVVRRSIPVLSSVPLDSTAFTQGPNVAIGRVRVTADAAGDIGWRKMVFAVNKSNLVTLGTLAGMSLWDGPTQVAGTFATSTPAGGGEALAAGATSGNLVFTANFGQQVAAGSSRTYELRVGMLASTAGAGVTNQVSVTIPQTSTATTTGTFVSISPDVGDATESFVWTDRSAIPHSDTTGDWTNDFLTRTLPLLAGNRIGT